MVAWNSEVCKMDMEAKSVNSNGSWYSTFHSIFALIWSQFLVNEFMALIVHAGPQAKI